MYKITKIKKNMANLQRYDNEGIELIIDLETGESFASISGYARMAGKAQSTISERAQKAHRSEEIKEAEVDTGHGVKLHRLIPENLIAEWLIEDNPEMAKQMLMMGVRMFIHNMAGYKYQVVEQTPAPFDMKLLKDLIKEAVDDAARPQLERIERYQEACDDHLGTGFVINSVASRQKYPEEEMTSAEFCRRKGLDKSLWATFAKRYGQFVRVGLKETPPKKHGKLMILGELYYYAEMALVSVMDLDVE
jgi:hypothetical protein